MKPSTGHKAPHFSLPDQAGTLHSLTDYVGRWVLLYFYPKDNTSGCTTEACEMRDSFSAFKENNIIVLGVSTDSIESHASFAEQLNLPFPLLADTDKAVVNEYGVWVEKVNYGKKYMGIIRTTFLITPDGAIAKIYEHVKPEGHANEILADVQKLKEMARDEA